MALSPTVSQKPRKKKRNSNPKATATAAPGNSNSDGIMMNMNEQFFINSEGGAVLQIRRPNPNDVLSGRGGSVNAHPGNIQFRDWVSDRRVDYNLAHSKNDKADICREIIAKVVALGGRFLGRDDPSSQFWVELDEERIMAKTSQALREGAPKIRQEHRDVADAVSAFSRTGKAKKRRSSAKATKHEDEANSTIALQPQQDKEEQKERKRVRVDYNGYVVRPNQASPFLEAQPAPEQTSAIEDHTDREAAVLPAFPARSDEKIHRENSLATSDITGFGECFNYLSEPFVDPFENETNELNLYSHNDHHDAPEPLHSDPPLLLLSPRNLPSPPPRLGVTRDTSTSNNDSHASSDMGGYGALMHHSYGGIDSSSLQKFLADNSISSSFLPANITNTTNTTNNNNHGVLFPLNHHHQQRPSLKRLSSSSRSSVSSALSDLPDAHRKSAPPSDFVEGMTMIRDALHPWKDEFNGNSNGRSEHHQHHHSRLGGHLRRRTTSSSQQ